MFKTPDDNELMARVANGDSKAFESLFKRHAGFVLGYASRLLGGDLARAEDVSQLVWMKVIRGAENYENRNRFTSWVSVITRNTVLNSIRTQQRHPEYELNEEMDTTAPHNVEESLIARTTSEKLKSAVDALPENQRLAFVMHMTEELSYEDIAHKMEMSLSSIKSLIFRARQNLEKVLKE